MCPRIWALCEAKNLVVGNKLPFSCRAAIFSVYDDSLSLPSQNNFARKTQFVLLFYGCHVSLVYLLIYLHFVESKGRAGTVVPSLLIFSVLF